MKTSWMILAAAFSCLPVVRAGSGTLDEVLAGYRAGGAKAFQADAGAALWTQTFKSTRGDAEVSCTSCHTADLRKPGRHARTGKTIEPMAPSVNPRRLTDANSIEKWFKRNCTETLGRECTPQEKGDVLSYLRNQ